MRLSSAVYLLAFCSMPLFDVPLQLMPTESYSCNLKATNRSSPSEQHGKLRISGRQCMILRVVDLTFPTPQSRCLSVF